ncbi:DUF1134 domain-containing protein [Ahrensia marina]|uniref:DUF1134 domain-containing protein n=1 Tax=Ahrensia marina TaxID=1514904 RepID=UPI0035D0B020
MSLAITLSSRAPHAWRRLQGSLIACLIAAALTLVSPLLVHAQQQQGSGNTFSSQELVDSGHVFFGNMARGMADVVESLTAQYGQPNGYILGEEASAAFFGGLRYGEGVLYTRNAGNHRVYWQGPSIGFDMGGDGTRTMILVYNLPSVDTMYQRFPGVSGSAFLVGGLSASANQSAQVVVAPIRAGIGARLGINVGYLKFTRQPTWNPF